MDILDKFFDHICSLCDRPFGQCDCRAFKDAWEEYEKYNKAKGLEPGGVFFNEHEE